MKIRITIIIEPRLFLLGHMMRRQTKLTNCCQVYPHSPSLEDHGNLNDKKQSNKLKKISRRRRIARFHVIKALT